MILIFSELMTTGLLQGLILGIVALGVTIPFRFLNLPDLTCDGAYPLGGALCTSLIISGVNPFLATLLASVAGGVLGMGTAFVHLRFKINTLLAGIILTAMTYSVNLRMMGKPNLALFGNVTLFSNFQDEILFKIFVLSFINIVIIGLLLRYCLSEKGLRFRAVGLNHEFSKKQGIHLSLYIFLGLFVGNALCSFAGCLMVQIQEYVDIGMGTGIVIHALAAVMIGESIMGSQTIQRQIIAPLIGAILYQQIQGFAISLGLPPSDLKFITGAIVLFAICYTLPKKPFARKRCLSETTSLSSQDKYFFDKPRPFSSKETEHE